MKKSLLILVFLALLLSACAAGHNTALHVPNSSGYIAGFWCGLWHGMIMWFTFIASLFADGVNIYEIHNSGILYNLGFLVGTLSQIRIAIAIKKA